LPSVITVGTIYMDRAFALGDIGSRTEYGTDLLFFGLLVLTGCAIGALYLPHSDVRSRNVLEGTVGL
jgi:hypothetical protein